MAVGGAARPKPYAAHWVQTNVFLESVGLNMYSLSNFILLIFLKMTGVF